MVKLGKFNEKWYGKSPRGSGPNDGGSANAPSRGGGIKTPVKVSEPAPPKAGFRTLSQFKADSAARNAAMTKRLADNKTNLGKTDVGRRILAQEKKNEPIVAANRAKQQADRDANLGKTFTGRQLLAQRKSAADLAKGTGAQSSAAATTGGVAPQRPMPLSPTQGSAPAPIKKAAGGAAKVRKGMMSPEGKILHAMNKVRGK